MAFTLKDWNINNCKGKEKVITDSNSGFMESEDLTYISPMKKSILLWEHRAMLLSTTNHALFSPG